MRSGVIFLSLKLCRKGGKLLQKPHPTKGGARFCQSVLALFEQSTATNRRPSG
jgi:hypothetical protein